ncbi:MAG: peptidyl-tRNA hydrolase [Candidatus Proteinoplasmatales archaeon SG8-5]|nr:MAG: peptidyl-tRNA hydrolase [Candidatus Proteinoplasmatales archaeon SG8-5]
MAEFEYKLVIVVRADLKLKPGKTAVQVAHASVNCALAARKYNKKWFRAWHDEGQKKVVVRCDSLKALHELQDMARQAKLPHSLISDAGLTEVPPGTVTCLGIGPAPEKDVDAITGELQLV